MQSTQSTKRIYRYNLNGYVIRECEICKKDKECIHYYDRMTKKNYTECVSCIKKKDIRIKKLKQGE